jgi:integrase
MGRLTARQVQTLQKSGRHSDGENLYLNITSANAKSWVFFYKVSGKQREMGLGSVANTSLAEARVKARSAMTILKSGRDPLLARQDSEKAKLADMTFGKFADEYIAAHQVKYRNAKHVAQWKRTLGPNYCGAIRNLQIGQVDTEAVLKVLHPIWQKIPETAARIRGRIENVIDAAKVQGLYLGDNPCRWKGHLKAVLPARQRLSRGHHAALPYDEMPAFMVTLRKSVQRSVAASALEFCILTAARSGEVLGAQWCEIDTEKSVWTIPAHRMKAGVEHRIPLSKRAAQILIEMEPAKTKINSYIFPSTRGEHGLSNMAMAMQLKGLTSQKATVHGFRSTFRDWASEQTGFSHEVCEMALAHTISNKAEAAYRRGDLFDKRRNLMDAWEVFCGNDATGKVINLRK